MSEQSGTPGRPDDAPARPASADDATVDDVRAANPTTPEVGDETDPYELRSVPTQSDPSDDDPASYLEQ